MPFATYVDGKEVQPYPLLMVPDLRPRGEDFPGEYFGAPETMMDLDPETYQRILETVEPESDLYYRVMAKILCEGK